MTLSDDFSAFLHDLYRAWCKDRGLNPENDDNKRAFFDEVLPLPEKDSGRA